MTVGVADGHQRSVALEGLVDLRGVLGLLVRGTGDPTIRVSAGSAIRASVTAAGPGTIELRVVGSEVRAHAWGAGAGLLLEGLPALLGLDDDDAGFEPRHHPVVAALARRSSRVRLGRTGAVWEALLPAILEQRITGTEAWRNYRRLVRAHGAPAPGPAGSSAAPGAAGASGLMTVPPAGVVAGIPQYELVAIGIEPRRATLLRRVAAEAGRLEALAEAARSPGGGGRGAANLASALRAIPGIGPWTAAEVTLRALGDPDAVSVGDFHLAHVVGFALAGRRRSTDAEMLELLAPWAGHRARVVRLLERAGVGPPRRGPRMAPRDLARDLTPPCRRRR